MRQGLPEGTQKIRYHIHVMNAYDNGANAMNVFQEKGENRRQRYLCCNPMGFLRFPIPTLPPVQIQPNVQVRLWTMHHMPESGYYVYEV